ncbi:hypothetical protein TGRUB_222935 [Toxoplasma gondii RUB]|uniref:Transmembrane protein n=5 Tax=Toxoplasma gondii TaxID=5811 RepID=V4YP06_TOXGV|nr:hypothetical protein TGVEG_222935 [Toxoplasma gondii VEG]KFG35972.1 hypothetical protein TGP89_222935 [Toxoplasma gondii p89]KFG41763.1 hypothetical protein TGDOM2_222935 [Toxoplasma gondii GAB2-2007-GAL-DOM2]KFG61218.1 hypothetical protein TGRUB_222935 [Toxoplasma gondii RUB]KFH03483.1 hypothetical protein TGVAND_222935 [Toxoplasma gondii VAND]
MGFLVLRFLSLFIFLWVTVQGYETTRGKSPPTRLRQGIGATAHSHGWSEKRFPQLYIGIDELEAAISHAEDVLSSRKEHDNELARKYNVWRIEHEHAIHKQHMLNVAHKKAHHGERTIQNIRAHIPCAPPSAGEELPSTMSEQAHDVASEEPKLFTRLEDTLDRLAPQRSQKPGQNSSDSKSAEHADAETEVEAANCEVQQTEAQVAAERGKEELEEIEEAEKRAKEAQRQAALQKESPLGRGRDTEEITGSQTHTVDARDEANASPESGLRLDPPEIRITKDTGTSPADVQVKVKPPTIEIAPRTAASIATNTPAEETAAGSRHGSVG